MSTELKSDKHKMASDQSDFWSQQTYDFGSFDYSNSSAANNTFGGAENVGGGFGVPSTSPITTFTPNFDARHPGGNVGNMDTGVDEDEVPLLEELGIDFDHIKQKTFTVLNPFRTVINPAVVSDGDVAGPLVFGLAFGALLMLTGKLHFSYIYGFGLVGCLLIYWLLWLMCPSGASLSLIYVFSILGYCLLPMVFLAGTAIFFALTTYIGLGWTIFIILWCSMSASKLFTTALGMFNQQALIAYPCILFYGVFALLALF